MPSDSSSGAAPVRPYRVLERRVLADVVGDQLADSLVGEVAVAAVVGALEDQRVDVFVHVADVEARNAGHAKQLAGARIQTGDRMASLWAVPDRNWNEEPISVRTETRVG